jgi:chromosome segregation protein
MTSRTLITRLSVEPTTPTRAGDGLKGQMFVEDIGGVDVFVGPNGAGKTTRGILSIVSALEGLARTPTDPRRPYLGASRPENTSVVLQTSDGAELVRDLSIVQGRRVAEVDGQARTLIGRLPTSWDLSDWSSGTAGTRGRILDDVARAGGRVERWDADTAQARVREIMAGTGEDDTVTLDALDACLQVHPSADDGETWIRAASTWATDYAAARNTDQREAAGHHRGIRERAPVDAPGDADADAATTDALLTERAELKRGDDRRRQALEAQDRSTRTGERLAAELSRLTAEGQRLAAPLAEPEAGPADADLQAALDRATTLHAEAVEDADRARADQGKASEALPDLTAAAQSTQHDHDAASDARRTARAQVAALEGLTVGDACAHCGEADPLGIGPRLDAARTALAAAEQAATATGALDLKARTLLQDARRVEHDARGAVVRAERAESRAATALTVADERLRGSGQARERAAARHAAQVDQRARDLAAARGRWSGARAAVDTWQAEHDAIKIPDVEDYAERLAAIRQDLAAIDERKRARLAVSMHAEAVEQAAQAYTDARAAWDSARALVAALRTARDELAAAAYAPIHAAARDLLDGAISHGLPLPYFRGLDDYGAEVKGRETPFHSLSESETMITAAALVCALSSLSGQPVRLVLLDGLEAVQSDHRGPLLDALVRAQRAGLVDNVVATMATSTTAEIETATVEGVTIHGPTYAQSAPPPRARARETSARPTSTAPAGPIPPTQGTSCPF